MAKLGACCLTLLVSCGSGLPNLPRGEHPMQGATPVQVDAAPPPAVAEQVPPRPADDCLWVEGHWLWRERAWHWSKARWIRLKEPCFYADSVVVWVPTRDGHGALFYTPGEWYKTADRSQCSSLQVCDAGTTNP